MSVVRKNIAHFVIYGALILGSINCMAQVSSGLIVNSLPLPKTPNQKPDATEGDVIIGNPTAALKGLAGRMTQMRISGFKSDIPGDSDGYEAIKPYLYKLVSGEEWGRISRELFDKYVERGLLVRADLDILPDDRVIANISELRLVSINVASPGFRDDEVPELRKKFSEMFHIGEPVDLKKLKSALSNVDYRGKAMVTTKFLQINADGIELKVRIEPRRTEPVDRWTVSIDNYGLAGFGRARLGLSYSAPLFSTSDNIGIQGIASEGLQNLSGRYDFPIPGGLPLRGSVWASVLRYSATVDEIRQRGNATLAGADLNFPQFFWSGSQLVWGVGYEYKHAYDSVIDIDTTRKTINNLHMRVSGAGFIGRRLDFGADVTIGNLSMNGGRAVLQDKMTAKSIGAFQKLVVNANFVQPITKNSNFSIGLNGQISSGNLDSLEKMYFGGPFGVSAYDNTINGDQGLVVKTAYAYEYKVGDGRVSVGPFFDYAIGQTSHSPWAEEFYGERSNVFQLADAGLQVGAKFGKVLINASLSHPVWKSAVDPVQGWRVWTALRASF